MLVTWDSLDAFLCPLQIFLHFFGSSHALGETRLCAHQSSLSELLQFEQFSVLGVEFARSVDLLTLIFPLKLRA